jgi:hypothetical protein
MTDLIEGLTVSLRSLYVACTELRFYDLGIKYQDNCLGAHDLMGYPEPIDEWSTLWSTLGEKQVEISEGLRLADWP